jgi:hypothetical protein
MNLNEARISKKHGELETTEKHQAEKHEIWSSIKQGAVSSTGQHHAHGSTAGRSINQEAASSMV